MLSLVGGLPLPALPTPLRQHGRGDCKDDEEEPPPWALGRPSDSRARSLRTLLAPARFALAHRDMTRAGK